mgnify:FL=1
MRSVVLIYPHQLFAEHPALAGEASPRELRVVLVEDPLFFSQYSFQALKLSYHRLSMAVYRRELEAAGWKVEYLSAEELDQSSEVFARLGPGREPVRVADPADDWLEQSLRRAARDHGRELHLLPSPGFLLSVDELREYEAGHRRMFMAEFYREQRRRMGILVEPDGSPTGGSWSFDADNRRKIPRSHTPPAPVSVVHGRAARAAAADLKLELPPYPVTRGDALSWLDEFLEQRLDLFGDYEDAIDARDERWYHGMLTPMLNTGLLTPREIVDRTLARADRRAVPINALEGFIRQLIGWREFMRMTYVTHGRQMRTTNFWNHQQPMPKAFYEGSTGLPPFDAVVAKTRRLAWAHHIERLMVAGNLMLLCEIHPDAVFRWFMELYIDAYDWVMVPNVYAMTQYADGGLITTKPYISGSNYLRKMSDAPTGEWQAIWDGLYWRFIDRHRSFFSGNPRLALMPKQYDRMKEERRSRILAAAENFLASLD